MGGKLLFIYGSLKRGGQLHHYMKGAKFIGEGTTLQKYPLLLAPSGWYPYLLNLPGRGKRVKGELYLVPLPLLRQLDRVEETPFYYIRRPILVKVGNRVVKAETYFKRKPIPFTPDQLLDHFPVTGG
jgi:gamma-glutamylaminecyclotransferase